MTRHNFCALKSVTRLSGLTLAITASLLAATAVEAAGPGWRTDYRTAEAEARQRKLPMLLHFYADWCGPCRRMDREVLNTRDLNQELSDGIIAVKINSDRYPQLVQKYQVRALPSDVFISPDGRVVSRATGYQARSSYVRKVLSVKSSYAPRREPVIAKPVEEEPVIADSGSDAGDDLNLDDLKPIDSVPVERPEVIESEVVGLDSYSPVSLWNWRQWRKGKSEFRAEFQGVVFYMADKDELEQFNKNPRRFAPHLLGCDPVILSDNDKAISGSTQYGAYFDGGLYLFSTKANRDRFKKAPYRFSRTQHAIKLDDIRSTSLN